MCPNCDHRVQQGEAKCSNCRIALVSGAYQIRVGGAYAVRDTSGIDPRLFLLVLVIGLVALFFSRGSQLAQNLLAMVNQALHTNFHL